MTKSKLLPLQVPWQIVTDTSYLRLNVSEVNNVKLLFVGQMFINNSTYLTEHEIEIEFKNSIRTQTSVKWSDRNTINPRDYDWSEVSEHNLPYKQVTDINEYERNYELFKNEWHITGICPLPNAYEVVDSDWSTNAQNFRHYLYVGADLSFECLASEMVWTNKGEVDWFKNS